MTAEHPVDTKSQPATTIQEIIRNIRNDRTRLLDVLRAVQQNVGFVSNEAKLAIAVGLGAPVMEVENTFSFYAFLNRTPKGRLQIPLSKTPISLLKGAAGLAHSCCAATRAPLIEAAKLLWSNVFSHTEFCGEVSGVSLINDGVDF